MARLTLLSGVILKETCNALTHRVCHCYILLQFQVYSRHALDALSRSRACAPKTLPVADLTLIISVRPSVTQHIACVSIMRVYSLCGAKRALRLGSGSPLINPPINCAVASTRCYSRRECREVGPPILVNSDVPHIAIEISTDL